MKKQFDPQDTKYRPIGETSMMIYGRSSCTMTNRRDVQRGLRAVKIGNKWMTTLADYWEYKEAQAQRSIDKMNGTKKNVTATNARSESKRARDIENAKRELAEA